MNDEPLLLLADAMLGRLAKWLRLLGYDTAYGSRASDPELAHRARAGGRVLLTRDRELAKRKGLQSLLIRSQVLEEQVREVREALGSPPHPALSRCPVCNALLVSTDPDAVAGYLPPHVLKTQSGFRRCPGCQRIYWPGSHTRAMSVQMAAFAIDEPEDV